MTADMYTEPLPQTSSACPSPFEKSDINIMPAIRKGTSITLISSMAFIPLSRITAHTIIKNAVPYI